MIAKEVVSIVLNKKSSAEIDELVPSSVFDETNPPCRLERFKSNKLDDIGLSIILDVCHNP